MPILTEVTQQAETMIDTRRACNSQIYNRVGVFLSLTAAGKTLIEANLPFIAARPVTREYNGRATDAQITAISKELHEKIISEIDALIDQLSEHKKYMIEGLREADVYIEKQAIAKAIAENKTEPVKAAKTRKNEPPPPLVLVSQ